MSRFMTDLKRNERQDTTPAQTSLPPILCTIPNAAAMIGRGTRFIYEAIATDKIKAVKSDKRTLIVVNSLHEYVAGRPAAKIKPQSKRQRAA
jgi:hypothetical protein